MSTARATILPWYIWALTLYSRTMGI